jgi:hypothetical protein
VLGRDDSSGARKRGIAIALGCAIVLVVVAIATGGSASAPDTEAPQALKVAGGSSGDGSMLVKDEPARSAQPAADSDHWSPVFNDEALPCTGPREPVNFETFSVGPSIEGLALTDAERRCGGGPVATRVNYLSYIYGDCKIPEGESGCQPPLEIQTWPACQRFLAKYSFRGKPLPHRYLPTSDGAKIVEFNFAFDKRIEVYTKYSTVVIFATDRARAVEAAEMLRQEARRKPPTSNPQGLNGGPPDRLKPPAQGSMEGDLSCQV